MYICLDINSTMYIINSKSFFVYFVYYYLYVVDNDRDKNSALNILALGHERLAVGIPVF